MTSLARRIIPCLDVDAGRVVKGVNFVDIRDAGDPVEIARRYNEEGADELAFLDITASVEQRDTTAQVVERIAREVFIPLTVGGGVRKAEDVRRLLNAGADKVAINTAAIRDPELVREAAERFGSQCIVVAIDARRVAKAAETASAADMDKAADDADAAKAAEVADVNNPRGNANGELHWEIFTHGGREPTGIDAIQWARRIAELGAGEILLTSMDRDGTKDGFDIPLTRAVADAVPVPVIASGGVGTLEHLAEGVLQGGADAVLAASIFHFGEYSIAEAKAYMSERGIEMRL